MSQNKYRYSTVPGMNTGTEQESAIARAVAMSGKRAADRQINNNMTEEELEGGSEEPVGTWQKADEVRARMHTQTNKPSASPHQQPTQTPWRMSTCAGGARAA